jgi:hypothetical protein
MCENKRISKVTEAQFLYNNLRDKLSMFTQDMQRVYMTGESIGDPLTQMLTTRIMGDVGKYATVLDEVFHAYQLRGQMDEYNELKAEVLKAMKQPE